LPADADAMPASESDTLTVDEDATPEPTGEERRETAD
jgi:hypothetical protein